MIIALTYIITPLCSVWRGNALHNTSHQGSCECCFVLNVPLWLASRGQSHTFFTKQTCRIIIVLWHLLLKHVVWWHTVYYRWFIWTDKFIPFVIFWHDRTPLWNKDSRKLILILNIRHYSPLKFIKQTCFTLALTDSCFQNF